MTTKTEVINIGTPSQLAKLLKFKFINIHYSDHGESPLASVGVSFYLPNDEPFTTAFAQGTFSSVNVNFTDYGQPRVVLFNVSDDGEVFNHVVLGADYTREKCGDLLALGVRHINPNYQLNI